MISLLERFNLDVPLVLAPMGGGPGTPRLAAAVSNAGGLGSLAAAYLTPAQIDEAAALTRSLTKRHFAINLFTPMPRVEISPAALTQAIEATREYRQRLGLTDPDLAPPYHPDFDGQFEAVLRARPSIFSFVFGLLDNTYLEACRNEHIFTIGTATTVEEALALESSGVDAVAVQGVEAGAHRGIFSPTAPDPGVGTLELTRQCAASLQIPLIAAGGLMTGADIRGVLRAGAQAAMLGTAFLLCPEAGTTAAHRTALRDRNHAPTRLTRAFSGRLARGIENQFLVDMEKKPSAILPFPAQNAFTRDLRKQAAQAEDPQYLSLWAGAGLDRIREKEAASLMHDLIEELRQAS